jgi:putative transposase
MVRADMRDDGVHGSHKRVTRLMRDAGLVGVSRRRGPRTAVRAPKAQPAQDLVSRDFAVSAPNRLWVGDITYAPTAAGFLFLPWWSMLSVAGW